MITISKDGDDSEDDYNANDGDDSEDDDDVLVELVLDHDQSLSQVIFTFLVEIQ